MQHAPGRAVVELEQQVVGVQARPGQQTRVWGGGGGGLGGGGQGGGGGGGGGGHSRSSARHAVVVLLQAVAFTVLLTVAVIAAFMAGARRSVATHADDSTFMETLPFACGYTLPVLETWSLVESWIDRPTSMCVGMGRFTILTLQTNISQVYITRLRRNRLFYAARHGYRYCELNATPDPLRPLAWGKIPALLMLLPRVTDGWVLFMDADAIITNHDVKLEKFLNLPGYSSVGKDLILTSDFDNPVFSVSPVTAAASINTGVFLIRNSKWSLSMLRSLYNDFPSDIEHAWWEQQALLDYRYEHPQAFSKYAVIIPYRYMNCWLEIPYCQNHEPSPFVVHAAGRDADKYRMLYLKFKEYPGEPPDKIAWVSRVAISV